MCCVLVSRVFLCVKSRGRVCVGKWVRAGVPGCLPSLFYLSTGYLLHTRVQERGAVGIQGPCFTEAALVEGL